MAAAPIAAQAQLSYPAEKWWDSRWYIAPFGSYTLADNDRRADDGWGGGISIGKAISPFWDLELRGSYEQLDANGAPSDWKNYTLGIDAKWYFLGREGLVSKGLLHSPSHGFWRIDGPVRTKLLPAAM